MIAQESHGRMLAAARWLVLAYVAAAPIVRPLDMRILGIHVFATDLVFAAAFVFWLASLHKRKPWFDRRYLVFAGAFFLALAASAALSTEPQKSLLKLIGVFYLLAVSVVICDLVRHPGFLRRLVYAWIAGSVVTILGTIIGLVRFFWGFDSMSTNFFLFHSGSLPPGSYPRVMAFFENPNMTANYLNVAAMIVLGAGRAGWISGRASLAIFALLTGSAVLTLSAGLGGIILSVGLWMGYVIFDRSDRRRPLVFAAAVTLSVAAFISTAISPVTRETENTVTLPIIEKRIEPSVRFLVWQNAIERGLEFPVLGRGTGTDAAHVRYQVLSGQRQLLRDAHQAWLNIFGQAGIVGLAAFLALCGYLFSICRIRGAKISDIDMMLAACSCAFVGAFLFQNLFGSFEDARQLWILIGMLVGLAGERYASA